MSQHHDYHLVDPSPWPLTGALSLFVLMLGALFYMHPDSFTSMTGAIELFGLWILAPGLLLILVTMFFWWKAIIHEGQQGFHKPVVQLSLRYGMIMFILSEVAFFAAFFWSFFNAAIPAEIFPPEGIESFSPWGLPLVNTLILLLSSTTVTWAHHAIRQNDRAGLITGLVITVALGLVFVMVQGYEYMHATFAFSSGVYATNFYVPTGFHGLHVIIGTIFLSVCLIRAVKGHFTPTQHFGLEAAAWYWHFVDVVWLFLFVCVYWWGGR